MIFDHFYSDPHFGHAAIIDHCSRPFRDVHDMTEELILRYNAHVSYKHLVLWLGDASFSHSDDTAEILSRLNGQKAIVLGNHDRPASWFLARGFLFALDEVAFRMGGKNFRASHYPLNEEDPRHGSKHDTKRPILKSFEWLLHGHTHSKVRRRPGRQIHVGVDAWEYRPASANEVIALTCEEE